MGQGGGGCTLTSELPLTARCDILAVWARECTHCVQAAAYATSPRVAAYAERALRSQNKLLLRWQNASRHEIIRYIRGKEGKKGTFPFYSGGGVGGQLCVNEKVKGKGEELVQTCGAGRLASPRPAMGTRPSL